MKPDAGSEKPRLTPSPGTRRRALLLAARVRRFAFAGVSLVVLLSACVTGDVGECVDRWNTNPPDEFDQAAVSAMWVAHQGAGDWEGRDELCWATIARSDGACLSASMFPGRESAWTVDESPEACKDGLTADWKQVTFDDGAMSLLG